MEPLSTRPPSQAARATLPTKRCSMRCFARSSSIAAMARACAAAARMVNTARIVKCLVLLDVISRHWGYDSFRPLQRDAMTASLDGRDSLVVMPTGGGKSLCYQAPAMLKDSVTVVVSPLISLMKDQVDGLKACGVPAAQMNSSQSPDEL